MLFLAIPRKLMILKLLCNEFDPNWVFYTFGSVINKVTLIEYPYYFIRRIIRSSILIVVVWVTRIQPVDSPTFLA